MVVGFACAVGIDMGFNSSHHAIESKVAPHAHKSSHSHATDHHNNPVKKTKDDCCNDKAVQTSLSERTIPQVYKSFSPFFFTVTAPVVYALNIFSHSQAFTSKKYFVRGDHPPIPDIRIAIRSFQI